MQQPWHDLFQQPQYAFLNENEQLKGQLILLGLGGSYAYGTNTEHSDLDIRGIACNKKEEILTGELFQQYVDENTDTTIYSFQKIITLLSNANPNTIELLGLKPEHYLYLSPVGRKLLEKRSLFLSRRCIHSFGGYANQQLYRLSQKANHSLPQAELEKHILKTMHFMSDSFHEKYTSFPQDGIKLYTDLSKQPDMDTEIYMDIHLTHYPLRDYCGMWSELQQTARSYRKVGMRNSKAIEHGKISKHMMHLLRLYMMCLDILEKEEIITYREQEHTLLMEIRSGAYLDEHNQPRAEFFDLVADYEKRLEYAKENTSLPEQPDQKKIREFVMSVNEQIVRNH